MPLVRRALNGARRAVLALTAFAMVLVLSAPRMLHAQDDAPRRLDVGRFTAVYFPRDDALAHSLLRSAAASDSFPWLPRPRQRVLVAIAPDAAHFRQWAGKDAPEWGAALAFPESRRVVMQGRGAGSDAGNPFEVLRHELAHLALHERLGDRPPRWFDEGYASVSAREWRRDDVLAANLALALEGTPRLDALNQGFEGGSQGAQSAYALSYRAVTELAELDPDRGLSLFFTYWAQGRTMDLAMRQAFGITMAGFEQRFQDRTQRRYGGLALFADFTILTLVATLLVMPFYFARRARDRKRLAEMLVADAIAEKAERESAIAALLGVTGGSPPLPEVPGPDQPH